jgi:hypothetical protein
MNSPPPYLVVPINVEALCVNAKTPSDGFLPPVASFDLLPYDDGSAQQRPFLSEPILAQPFSTASAFPGVHLHWAMPDALMHGEQAKESTSHELFHLEPAASPLKFPKLPDRWLVTRTELIPGSSGKVTSWVVDSRFLSTRMLPSENPGSCAVPWENPGDNSYKLPPFRYLGRTLPLETWTAPPSNIMLAELTAASFGFIQAPAYYPSCRNVFGMHHPAPESGAATEYAYVVCGWHSVDGDDPLRGKTAQEASEILARLRWKSPVEGAFEAVLYVGIVHSVRWDPITEPEAPQTLTAIFGNTTAEANAVLHQTAARASEAFATKLQALLSGQLDRLSEPGGEPQVQRQFHQQRFSPTSYGNLWYVSDSSDGNDVFPSLTDVEKGLLLALNAAERKHTASREEALALQWQLFSDWYKYLKCRYPGPQKLPDADQVRDFIKEQSLPEAQRAIVACKLATRDAAIAYQTLADALKTEWKVSAKPQPESWRPVDPVLLLQGPDVKPAMRFGGDGELPCQIFGGTPETGLFSALDLNAGAIPGIPAARLDAAQDTPVLDSRIAALGPPQSAFEAAALESLLVWPAWAGAQLAFRAGKAESALTIARWLATCDVQATPSIWTGNAPSPRSITVWAANPWLPIMMHWHIDYEPLAIIRTDKPDEAFRADMLAARLSDSLNAEETDLVLNPPGPHHHREGDRRSYHGINFITPQAGQRVKQQIRSYAATRPRSLLAAMDPATDDIPLLSQSLSGFHDRLLLRRQTFQVDIRDPFALTRSEKNFGAEVKQAVMDLGSRVSTVAPMVQDAFNPVRGGDFTLRRLWLGDVFGQGRRYLFSAESYRAEANGNRVIAAAALGRDDGSGSLKPTFPPRLSQPARLDFHWLSAISDAELTGEDPLTSPVCGWIVPNYLDSSLAIYDERGDSLGSIVAIADSLHWQSSPAHPDSFGTSVEDVFRNRNSQLRDYTFAFLHHEGQAKFLAAYLAMLNKAANLIQPLESVQHVTLPALVGHPLALTRASLKLTLSGPPAVNQTWSAFERDLSRASLAADGHNKAMLRTTNEHQSVLYPVVLGMANDPDDGLIGFYQGETEGESRFGEFFVVTAGQASYGITPSDVHTLQLKPSDPRRVLTMLVDPRAQVIVTTGYAPAQVRTLPPDAVKAAIEKIAVTFLTAPILTTDPPPDSADATLSLPLPLPGQQRGSWQWLRVADDAAGTQIAIAAGTETINSDEVLSSNSVYLQDGWLSLSHFPESD